MDSDEVLMLRFQAGSRESLEELFERYRNPLYGFFCRRLSSRERSEDLAQETWMAVLRGVERYQPRALFRTYLYGIALKLVANERRRNAKQKTTGGEEREIADREVLESGHWIREALARLDPTEREIILLREYEQLSYAEVAELLRIPLNTVRSRLFRARMELRRLLDPNREPVALEGRS